MTEQSGDLRNLNPLLWPDPVPWWPMAPGWYVLMGVIAIVLLWLALRALKRWQANEYRREALAQLDAIRRGDAALEDLPALLKRTALTCFERADVAALSGHDWHEFLDRTGGQTLFADGPGQTLDQLSYRAAQPLASSAAQNALMQSVETWVRCHVARPRRSAGARP
jgi:hypothetical protein